MVAGTSQAHKTMPAEAAARCEASISVCLLQNQKDPVCRRLAMRTKLWFTGGCTTKGAVSVIRSMTIDLDDRELNMRTIITGVLTVGLAVVATGPSDAASKKRYYYYNSYSQKYPYATPRQLQNARAYDHAGQYFEVDSNAFPVGSRGWWEMKRLEDGSRRR